MTPARQRVRVARKWEEAVDACGIELRPLDGEALPPFEAGAHIDLVTPGGHVRQYSLCNAPHDGNRYEICVLRAAVSRGGSASVHDGLAVGQVVEIGPPRNLFRLAPAASPAILIAGGIGITPIASMAQALAARDLPFEVHYASRSLRHAALAAGLRERLGERLRIYAPDTAKGRLDVEDLVRRNAANAHFYVCGPGRLIDATVAAAQAAGVPSGRVHHERFAPADEVPALTQGGADAGFELFLARSVRSIAASRSDTVLQALRRAGVEIATSCEQGVCGTCMTTVLEGEVDHQDFYLGEDEKRAGNVIIPCCSHARSARLVLDL